MTTRLEPVAQALDPRVIAAARALYDLDHSGYLPSWLVPEEHPERYVWGKEAARIIAVLDALALLTKGKGR